MATKFIFHYKDVAAVNTAAIDAAVNEPIVVLKAYDGKHTQVKIRKFNLANQDKEALSFADRIQYYAKTFRRFVVTQNTTSFTINVAAISSVFDNIGIDLTGALAFFLDGLTNPITTGYEGNFIGFFDGNSVDLESGSPAAATDFIAGLTGN